MSALDLSGDAGLAALYLLTLNISLGLLLSTKYNPVKNWPYRRINTVKLHNWTGYLALSVALLHPTLLLASSTAGFKLFDVLFPLWSPIQPLENTLGALALYTVAFTVVTSYFRFELGRKLWKKLHYAAYGAAALFFIHGLLTDPELENNPLDPFDGEKVTIELCLLFVVVATVWRLRYALDQRKMVRFAVSGFNLALFPESGRGGQALGVLEGYFFNKTRSPVKLHRVSMAFRQNGVQKVIGPLRDSASDEYLEAVSIPPRRGINVSLYALFNGEEVQELLDLTGLKRAEFVGRFPDGKALRKKLAGLKVLANSRKRANVLSRRQAY